MTTEHIDIGERLARLANMRAEFRAAQERRDQTNRNAAAKRAAVVEPELAPDAEPPARATP